MGNFDYKNICLQIEIKDNLTDKKILDFMKNWDFTIDEYMAFFKGIKDVRFNEISNKIISFFVDYKNGLLLPDRCGTYEPLKHVFDKNKIFEYQGWLSTSGGCLHLKKRQKYDVLINNRYWTPCWSEENPIVIKPIRALPKNLGIITFWFSKQKKINMDFLKSLLLDFCEYLSATSGIIFDQEDNTILFDAFNHQNIGKCLEHISFD